ncbi:(2Fe-2S)-binding protein [Burkholderia aenigmatica]|nr:(2Fe-2S)-binding protein [Burkholderia aenigmatica]
MKVCATVNGRERHFEVSPRRSLADTLRYELRLTGTKVGCEHGVCGACTILVDGQPMRSCLMLGVQAQDRIIETVEGLAADEQLHPLQESFQRHHALQCGFCTSGFLATARALLSRNPNPSREAVREAISGNICRCTGYETIVDAIVDASTSTSMQGGRHEQE